MQLKCIGGYLYSFPISFADMLWHNANYRLQIEAVLFLQRTCDACLSLVLFAVFHVPIRVRACTVLYLG